MAVPPLPQPIIARVCLVERPSVVLAPGPLPEAPDTAAFAAATTAWRWQEGVLWVKLPAGA
jgi:hypothetical protein